jgi:hypothetical protein
MTTRTRILIALGLFIVPILARFLLFYQLPYSNAAIQRPNYTNYKIPEPPTPSSSNRAVAASVNDGKVVIVDAYHGNQYEPSELEPLVTAISARGARVEFDKGAVPLAMQLKYASAYVVLSPSIIFSGEELRAMRQFVDNGGRLLVFADPTRSLTMYDASGAAVTLPDVNYANPLLAPFGLTFVNDYLYNLQDNEGNFRNVKFTDFADNPITAGLQMAVFYGAHSIQTNAGTALMRANKNTFSSVTDKTGAFAPLVLSSNGQVLAAGDFSFLTNPFNQVADNGLLLGSIADFALGGERVPSLVNFPYMFSKPVTLVMAKDVELNASLLEPISLLQNVLKTNNVALKVREAAPAEGNLIILGTFKSGADVMPYIKSFGINLEDVKDVVEMKGFGAVSATDSGLLLFTPGQKSSTLVLLAPDTDTLPALIKLVASGDLSACVVQDNIGVCSVKDASYNDYYGGSDSSSESETPTLEATPSSTKTPDPTPAG